MACTQIASMRRSLVRMRMISSTGRMQIFPSPIRPVRMGYEHLNKGIDLRIVHKDLQFDLGQKIDHRFRATIQLCVSFLSAKAFH